MAARFWVGGTGNTSDTAHWSATTGGAGGETVPVAGDTVTFDSNSGTAATVTVDVALSAASITINKSDLTLTHSAGTTLTGTMTLTAGTLNTNGQTCSWGSFSSSNSNARTLTMGASAITITSGGTSWDTSTPTNLSTPANTATLTMSGASALFNGGSRSWTGMSIVFSGSGAARIGGGTGNVFANVTRTGTAAKTDSFLLNASLSVTGTMTLGGNTTQGVNRLLVQGLTVGTQATITAAAYVITGDVDFMDINLAYSGGASWTNAGSAYIGDALGNAGAVTTNATVSATQTATGTASFTWSTHGWTSRVPLPQDDVVINNAFVAGRTVTADMPRLGRSVDGSSCTGSPTFGWNITTSVFGSLNTAGFAARSGSQLVNLLGRGSHTLGGQGSFSTFYAITQDSQGGTYTVTSYVVLSGSTYTLTSGTLNTGAGMWIGAFSSTGSGTRTINFSGTSSVSVISSGTVWNVSASLTVVISSSGGVNIADTSVASKTFAGAGLTYPILTFTATGSGALTITGNNTFTNLDLECTTARTITFPSSGTQTITGTLTLLGATGQLLSLRSSSTGTKWYINAATTSAQYCDVKDCTASGTGTPIDNSTGGVNSGNNIGWLFIAGGSAGYSSTLLTLGVG